MAGSKRRNLAVGWALLPVNGEWIGQEWPIYNKPSPSGWYLRLVALVFAFGVFKRNRPIAKPDGLRRTATKRIIAQHQTWRAGWY